jgi:AraC-like DNA-binding protein
MSLSPIFSRQILTSYGSVELIHSGMIRHHFPRHFHENFPFGVIEEGGLGFQYRGKQEAAWKGSINLANPGEVHDGFPISDQGWQYRMFYVDCNFIREIAGQGHNNEVFPWFTHGVIENPVLAQAIGHLHRDIQSGWLSQLAIETRLFVVLSQLIQQHAQLKPREFSNKKDFERMDLICDYIRESSALPLSLKSLADTCGFSAGYFIRTFRKRTGMTPHQYQLTCRLEHAKAQLLSGGSLSQTAVENGFVDQSHFTHTFQHFYGFAPGNLTRSSMN